MNKQLSENLHFLLSEYLTLFVKLRSKQEYQGSIALIENYEKIKSHIDADNFFKTYGVGNQIFSVDQPLERSQAYELLLYILQQYDKKQFLVIHKGTPYYFIGWTAYQFGNVEKAFFYLDAAVSEDLKIYEEREKAETPAISLFLLRDVPTKATGFVTLHAPHNFFIGKAFSGYCAELNLEPMLYKYGFVERFVTFVIFEKDEVKSKKMRSILTALYGFLSEYGILNKLIFLRSSQGGTIEPFINHLFKGARILESLLKLKTRGSNLKVVLKNLETELELNGIKLKSGSSSLVNAVNKYKTLKTEGKNFQICNFEVAYIIRNTTGHSLLWEDLLTEEIYLLLYNCLVNSILWSIDKLWINNKV